MKSQEEINNVMLYFSGQSRNYVLHTIKWFGLDNVVEFKEKFLLGIKRTDRLNHCDAESTKRKIKRYERLISNHKPKES